MLRLNKLLPSCTWLWLMEIALSDASFNAFADTVPSAPFPFLYSLVTSHFSFRSQLRCDVRILSGNRPVPFSLDELPGILSP